MATTEPKQRVPAAERRTALVEAALEEFARGGFHGTPVGRIAARVGVAQPYVFSLFPTKRDLFVAAVELGFKRVGDAFTQAAAEYKAGRSSAETIFEALGDSYVALVESDRAVLMTQLQAYSACDDPVIREHVRDAWRGLTELSQELTGATPEELSEFFSIGMWLTVQAAIGVKNLAELCQAGVQPEY